jgi:hypothetical protein
MPPYLKANVNQAVQQAVPGLPAYAFGSLNRLVAPTRMNITSGSVASNVASITGVVIEGNIPVVGQLVTITGCSQGTFDVTNVSIASVSAAATPDAGVYTITFALTTGNIASVPLTGLVVAPQIEVGDTLVNGSSQAIAIQANTGPENGRAVRVDVTFPSIPTTALVVLQGADVDLDAQYVTIGTIASVAGSSVTGQSVTFDGIRANFLRLNVSTLAGSGTVVGKILV